MDTLAKAHPHARDAFITFVPEPHSYVIKSQDITSQDITSQDITSQDITSQDITSRDIFRPFTSVTTWLHTHFSVFDADAIISKMQGNAKTWPKSPYYGQSAAEIKAGWAAAGSAAAALGTQMHAQIEAFYNMAEGMGLGMGMGLADCMAEGLADGLADNNNDHTTDEFKFFLQFHAASKEELTPYRTEWTVFHEEWRLAGSIDMVFTLPDGTLAIYDWKRAKEIKKTSAFGQYALTPCISHLPDTNFWHYALQLNTYKAILEAKYEKKVTRLCLVVLHPNQTTYKVWTVPDLSADVHALLNYIDK